METLGNRKFVEVPGTKTHELPPLLVRMHPEVKRLDKVMGMASDLVEQEDMIPVASVDSPGDILSASITRCEPLNNDAVQMEMERRRMDLALNLVEQYMKLIEHWQWGDSILEWIRQCEITFGSRLELRHLLSSDVWPHAGRSSFVLLLGDKAVRTRGVALEKAVGMRLTFRKPPPLRCFSDQFLFYLNAPIANHAYQTWAAMSSSPVSSLPPERFHLNVVNMSLD